MSIASKLQTVAENEQRVYNAGCTAGRNEWDKAITNNYTRTNFGSLYVNCTLLTTVPPINIASGTIFSSMFANCSSLITVPPLNTANGESFTSMFLGCSSLTAIPQLNVAKGTSFASMLNGCRALITVPPLNTASGTTFDNMFSSCSLLTTIQSIDLSNATSFVNMFYNCSRLTAINFSGSIKITGLNLQRSPLTITTLRSLINALEPKTSGTFKVTVGSANLAKLTSDDLDLISEKGWTFV